MSHVNAGHAEWHGRPMRFLGIDLAWGEATDLKPANRSGVVALELSSRLRLPNGALLARGGPGRPRTTPLAP